MSKELSFREYKKLVESVKYRDFSISLSDVAKYPGELVLEYKYQISCLNWEGSGYPGTRIIFPAFPPLGVSRKKFQGFTFDNRNQLTKTALKKWLKEVADKGRYQRTTHATQPCEKGVVGA